MRTWRSLGLTQKKLLQGAALRPLRLTRHKELSTALKLHDYGLLSRGRTRYDYDITQTGLEIINGQA